MNGAAVSNNMDKDTQYGPPSDGITIWGAAVSQTSDPNLGGFKFISDINGICEIRYGAAWIDWTVAAAKISLNGNVIYSTRSTSTIETFTVSIGDEILIYEEYSVLNLYTVYLRRLESNISNWDVSNVTDMSEMFYGVSSFNEPIGNWNVSNVTTLNDTFNNASAFNQTLVVNNFGFESDLPANFGIMAHNLIAIGGSNSDTHCSIDAWALTDYGEIILYNRTSDSHGRFCRIDLSGDTVVSVARYLVHSTPTYNSRSALLNGYNTATSLQNYVYFTKGTNFDYITFTNNGWNVSKVTSMANTFSNASVFNKPLNSWDVSNVTNLNAIFYYALSFNQPIGNWDVSNVTTLNGTFYNASAFNQTLGLNNFGTGDDLPANFGSMTIPVHNVTCSVDRWAYYEPNKIIIYNYTEGSHGRFALITMNGTYENNSSRLIVGGGTTVYNTRDELIDDYNIAYIASYSNEHSFESGAGFNNITVTNGWDVSKVTSMANTFRNTSAFNQPIGSWNVSSVDRMDYTFASSVFNQPLGNNFGFESDLPADFGTFVVVGADVPNQNIDQWAYDTSDNTIILARNINDNAHTRFCKINVNGIYISNSAKNANWNNTIMNNQTEVIDRYNSASSHEDYHQFTAGSGFDDITFSNGWNVSSVTTFNNMFHSNASFNQNISKWNVSSATNIEHMFRYASAFNQDISDWDVSNVTMGFYDNNYGHASGHSSSIFRGIINLFRDDSHGSSYNFTSNYDLVMTSTVANFSGSEWGNQDMHFQTKFNNYLRVDFRFNNVVAPNFCVGLTKEDFGSVGKSLITAKAYYDTIPDDCTYFQIHNNNQYTFVEDDTISWTNVGHTSNSNETICSIICSDYWDENPFGTDPTNIGTINANPGPNLAISSWGLDEDGYIILELRGITVSDGYNYYIKIDKQGNMKDGSSYYKAAGGAGTTNAPTSLSDLISRYYNGNGSQTYSFNKATNFPMPKIIKYVINDTLVYETPTDYTGKFYIAALINGPGSIEFFPNSGTYFDCFYHEAAYGSLVGGSAGSSNVVNWLGDGSDTAKENIHNGSMAGYGSSTPYWGRDVTSGDSWVGFELNQSKTITSYRIWPLAGKRVGPEVGGTFFREQTAPRDWTIQGSNDNSNWTVIDTQTDETFTVGLTDSEAESGFGNDVLLDAETDAIQYSNLYNIANPGSYKYYKINITDTSNRTYDSYTMVTEIAYYI